ncbi:hypothetical protein D3C72_1131670 [compost metagenome]
MLVWSLPWRQPSPCVPEYSSARPRPFSLVPPMNRLGVLLVPPPWLALSTPTPTSPANCLGIERVTKLMMPPTFCGP